jgi:hypothetical protein
VQGITKKSTAPSGSTQNFARQMNKTLGETVLVN